MPPVKKTEEKPGEDQPKYLTAEDVEEMLDAKVNGAITERFKRFEGAQKKDLDGRFGEIRELLAAKKEEEEAANEKAAATPKQDEPAPWKKEIAKLEKQLAVSESARAEEAKAREVERQARMRDEERSTLASALRKGGADEVRVKAALALLHTEEKRVARNEEGKIVFRAPNKHGGVDDLEVEAGVTAWLKTDEGKLYVPPRQAGGSGGSGGKLSPPNGKGSEGEGAMSDRELGLAILEAIHNS